MADIPALKRRAASAWRVADQWHHSLREIYRWCAPERYQAMVAGHAHADIAGAGGQKPMFQHIFDPVGMQALEDGAAQIAEAIHPWDQPWARWSPRPDIDEDDREQVEEIGDQYTDVCESLLSRSNFHTAAVAAHKDFLCIGGFMSGERDPEDRSRIRWTASPAYHWAVEVDVSGRTTALFRKMAPPARSLDYVFGEKPVSWSDQARQMQRENPERPIELMFCLYWQFDAPMGLSWRACVYEVATEHEVYTTGYRVNPVVFYRPNAIPGLPWGSGPAMRALPDIRVANKVVELVLSYALIAATGIYTAEDDGVLNPRVVRLVPGEIIPIAQGSGGLKALEMPGRFDVSQLLLDQMRANIRRAFYVTRVEERPMTAQEYSGRLQQQMREMRGMYGQLRSEFAEGVMLRTLDLAETMGAVERADLEKLTQVLLVGPLAQDVAGAEVDRVLKVIQDVALSAGPQVAMGVIKLETFVPYLIAKRHAEPDVFKNKAQLVAMQAEAQKMIAQAAQPQGAPQGAPPPVANGQGGPMQMAA